MLAEVATSVFNTDSVRSSTTCCTTDERIVLLRTAGSSLQITPPELLEAGLASPAREHLASLLTAARAFQPLQRSEDLQRAAERAADASEGRRNVVDIDEWARRLAVRVAGETE